MEDIPREKLIKAGKYLDAQPPQLSNAPCKDEYWRQFIDALPHRVYTNSQIESFAEELFQPIGSPGLRLLVDLTIRGLEYEVFLECLQKIKCYKALNLFVQSTIPVIKLQPEDQSVPRGGILVLLCNAECSPPPQYQWYWEGNLLPGYTAPQLQVNNMQSNMMGRYACKVTNRQIADNKHNHVWSNTVIVEMVKHPVQASDDPHVDQYMSNQPSSMDFTTSSSSFTSLSSGLMSRNSHSPQVRRKEETDGGTAIVYQVNPVSPSSMGTTPSRGTSHSLGTASSMGTTPSMGTMNIHSDSSDIVVTKQLKDTSCKYNEVLQLECGAKSSSGKKLMFTWFEKKGTNRKKLHEESSTHCSKIKHKHKWSRPVTIVCEVTHADKGSADKVEMKAKVNIITVWITEQPKDIKGVRGEQIVLSCKAEGKGDLHYYLFKGNNMIERNDTGNFSIILEEDAWNKYKFQAANAEDFANSDEFDVTFRAENRKPLCITEQPMSVVCERGEDVTLMCKAEPDRGTHYQWYFNDSPMILHVSNEVSLVRINNTQFGKYHCVVKNKGESVTTNKVYIYPRNTDDKVEKRSGQTQHNQKLAEQVYMTENDPAMGTTGVPYACEKVALLIGNQNYIHMNKLTSPHSDVVELKETLTEMDFKVFMYFDLNYDEMIKVLKQIRTLLGPGVYFFFYFSGHGFHFKLSTSDYIMPVDATKGPVKCVDSFSVPFIIKNFQETLCKAFIFFDSCRTSYTKPGDVLEPKTGPTELLPYSNLFRVMSCSANTSAYEKKSRTCSVFNQALRTALQDRKDVNHLGSFIMEEMVRQSESKAGKEYQRPDVVSNMRPATITLHEEIMREAWTTPPFDAKKYSDMYESPNDFTLTLTGFAEAKVTVKFLALNCIKIVTTPINKGHCKSMETMVNIESESTGEERDDSQPTVQKSDNEGHDDVFLVTETLDCKKLVLNVELCVVTNNNEEHKTNQTVDVKLHQIGQ